LPLHSPPVVVNDSYVVGVALLPAETDAPLVVYPDTVLALALTLEGLEAIGGRHPEVLKALGPIEHPELSQSATLEVRREPANRLPVEERLRFA